jgi:hypothetical protein
MFNDTKKKMGNVQKRQTQKLNQLKSTKQTKTTCQTICYLVWYCKLLSIIKTHLSYIFGNAYRLSLIILWDWFSRLSWHSESEKINPNSVPIISVIMSTFIYGYRYFVFFSLFLLTEYYFCKHIRVRMEILARNLWMLALLLMTANLWELNLL